MTTEALSKSTAPAAAAPAHAPTAAAASAAPSKQEPEVTSTIPAATTTAPSTNSNGVANGNVVANGSLPKSTTPTPPFTPSNPLKVPLPEPLPHCTPPDPATLTPEQQAKYDWLLTDVQSWTDIPCSQASKSGPLTDGERLWLTRECLIRFLRATRWAERDSARRLRETLAWRREYGVDGLTGEHIGPENATGKQAIIGFDHEARVCLYLSPHRQNTEPSARQIQHLVFMVERVLDLLHPRQETMALLINFVQGQKRGNTAPGVVQAREVLNILQMHYPERLGKALVINVPWIVWGFFKVVTPLLDPRTREKLKFNEDLRKYVPAEHLWHEFNGNLHFDYNHDHYWPALLKLCQERREATMQRWIAGGKRIGELEEYLAGGIPHGVAGPLSQE